MTSTQLTTESCDDILQLLSNVRQNVETVQRDENLQKLRLIASSTEYQINRIRHERTEDILDGLPDVLNQLMH